MNNPKIIALALAAALCLTGCAVNGAGSSETGSVRSVSLNEGQQQGNPAESIGSGSQGLAAPVLEFRINPDVMSDLGLTYDQMVEKRGKLRSNTYKGVLFENGIGRYGWKSEGKSFLTDDYTDPGGLPDAGGCNWIDGLDPQELFEGLTYPVSMDIFSDKYGFVPISIGNEQGMDNCYWSSFTHPMYEGVEFIIWTDEYGIIDEGSGCILSLDVDSLDLKPDNNEETTPTHNSYQYGEVEIPEVSDYLAEKDKLLETMLFESYEAAGYTFKLVGKNVGKVAGYPDGIIHCNLSVEVEKDGKIIEESRYNPLFTFVSAPSHEKIIEGKIGNYLDVYDLEVPVVAMKYYFMGRDPSEVDSAVEFSRLVDGELWSGMGICDKDTGLQYGNSDGNLLYLNQEDGVRCRINTFQADEFKIVDKNTLIDEQANFKFTFDLSTPPIEDFYTVTAIS